MKILKNASWDNPSTIIITSNDPEWEEAYANWLKGKNPTPSKEWKFGVFFAIRE